MKKILFPMLLALAVNGLAKDVTPHTQVVLNQIHYEHVVWNGIPISFDVPEGQERILRFPEPVMLHNSNPKLTTQKVSILNNDGFLYITAKKAFGPIRIPFVIKSTGEVVLVDLSGGKNGNDTPVSVVLQSNASSSNQSVHQPKPQFINYVTLMRYAIKHLYSPERLLTDNLAISRTPMYTSKSVRLFSDGAVMAMPLISWRGGNLYVTAVLLKNTWHQRVVLDPRHVNGSWLAASFYPTNTLNVNGSRHDRTTLFLISDQPFNTALNQVRGYI